MNSCIILCIAVILIFTGNVTYDNHKFVYNIMYCCQCLFDRQCDMANITGVYCVKCGMYCQVPCV